MNKKFLSLLLALILCFALVPAVLADSSKSVVYDQEQLFGEADTEMLNARLAELCDTYNVDVAIVTTTSLDGKTAQEYADDFYDENGIGGGDSKGGILLMISSAERKWAISTAGYGIFAFTDDDLEYISDNFLPYLSDGDWYSACTSFISDCGPCLVAAEEDDQPYDPDDFDNDYDDNYEPITSSGYFSIAWLGMALIVLTLARVVNWCFRAHYPLFYHAVFGIVLASTVVIIPLHYDGARDALLCLLAAALGALAAYLSAKLQPKEDA